MYTVIGTGFSRPDAWSGNPNTSDSDRVGDGVNFPFQAAALESVADLTGGLAI